MQSEILIQAEYGELQVSGSLDAESGKLLVNQFSYALSQYAQTRWQINLQDAELSDGRSLTPLLDCLQLAINHGSRLELTGLSPRNRMLLRISRFDCLFDLEEEKATAA